MGSRLIFPWLSRNQRVLPESSNLTVATTSSLPGGEPFAHMSSCVSQSYIMKIAGGISSALKYPSFTPDPVTQSAVTLNMGRLLLLVTVNFGKFSVIVSDES